MKELISEIFKNPLMNITFSVGLILIVAGFIMFKFPPKEINSIYGYRTSSSMKNIDRWKFAQRYSSKEMIKLGFILMLTTTIGFITHFSDLINMFLGLGLMTLTIVILIIRVENAIKKRFPNE